MDMKYCPDCGYKLVGTEEYCPDCRFKLERASIEVQDARGSIGLGSHSHIVGKNVIFGSQDLRNSFNEIEIKYDKETSDTLAEVAEFIKKCGDQAAGRLFDSFTEELNKPQPEKGKLKSFWSALEKVLPAVNTIAGVATKIVPLFL